MSLLSTLKSVLPFLARRCRDYFRRHRVWRLRRGNGFSRYTVISAVYNVERYLDAYFSSLTRQTLDFTKHIFLILIDDGSTDGSAAVIEKWRARYPANVTYLYQKNAGQGAARNAGIPLATTPWVTFVDPDDFVDVTYFQHVDRFLKKHAADTGGQGGVKFLSCCFIKFWESSGTYKDTHSLRYRYARAESLFPAHDPGDSMQMSVAHVFFPLQELKRQKILFSEARWGVAEDLHFMQRYMLNLDEGVAAFHSFPRYYYRKRASRDSSLDRVYEHASAYEPLLRECFAGLIRLALLQKGRVPLHLQYVVCYSLSWKICRFLEKPPPAFLTPDRKREYITLLRDIFRHIDTRVILACPGSRRLDAPFKVGAIEGMKGETIPDRFVYLEDYDPATRLARLCYYFVIRQQEAFAIDGRAVYPALAKESRLDCMGQPYCFRRHVWLCLPPGSGMLNVRIGRGRATRLCLEEQRFGESVPVGRVTASFGWTEKKQPGARQLWIFLDRDISADDNAEHLYRHVRENAPEIPAYFALRKGSPDWERLRRQGFRLLDFGSARFERKLRQSTTILSSHLDDYIVRYFPDLMRGRRFVYLRHGYVQSDVSGRFNRKKIDLLITANPREHAGLTADGSLFAFSKKTVRLTGYPRHDALLRGEGNDERLIAVLPTWREYLVGPVIGKGHARALKVDFMHSEYATRWRRFLNSDRLADLTRRHGYRVALYPHLNMQPYLAQFRVRPEVEVLAHGTVRIQSLLHRARVLITDYSSVAFESAYLSRSVIYYQFDRAQFLAGHSGGLEEMWDYRRDGFGPVATSEGELFAELEAALSRRGKPAALYARRMREAFPFRDGNCCERVLHEIRKVAL